MIQLVEDRRFYVYVYLDVRKQGNYIYQNLFFNYCPIYIGKGQGSRDISHLKCINDNSNKTIFYNILRKLKKLNLSPIIIRIKEHLTERTALNLEIEIIKKIGRINKKTGPLANLTDGGDSATYIRSKSTIKKILQNWQRNDYREKVIDGSRNNWKIIFPNNSEIIIRDLAKWCKENNFSYSACKGSSKRRKIYKGYYFINLDKNKNLSKDDFSKVSTHQTKRKRKGYSKFEIKFKNGKVINIENSRDLKKWCEENSYNYSGVKGAANSNLYYCDIFKIFYTPIILKWKIIYTNKRIEIVKNLKRWCDERKYNVKKLRSLSNTKKIYENFIIEKIIVEEKREIKPEKKPNWKIIHPDDTEEFTLSLRNWTIEKFKREVRVYKKFGCLYYHGYKFIRLTNNKTRNFEEICS